MTKEHAHFSAVVPGFMAQLIRDFPELTPLDAAAIMGNAGHESGGLVTLQEIKPTVAGSRGGWGWMQWTGPRRRAFEAYCKRNKLNPSSDQANYAWLYLELKGIEGTEGKAIGKLIGAGPNLEAKVTAFEKAFLRAGIKHYPSRLQWAERAIEAWRLHKSTGIPIPSPTPAPAPKPADPVAHANANGVTAGLITFAVIAILVVIWFVFFKR